VDRCESSVHFIETADNYMRCDNASIATSLDNRKVSHSAHISTARVIKLLYRAVRFVLLVSGGGDSPGQRTGEAKVTLRLDNHSQASQM
jgi:hypothetical protein